ncbi:MAG: Acg family FMN-binding oxidoreductase [Jatrophihabitans sp.]|uniref:Acg family FMN-binding oxidoreductase n=1 Tax=Jatrophihabitans sp. TaxID=1932789 RepID=UPI003F7F4D4A
MLELMLDAARQALLAPSIHNTQPWRFRIDDGVLELHADRDRRLQVLDPFGRQLTISCGCALFNVRVALAAAGYSPLVQRLPNSADPTLLARVTVGPPRTYLPVARYAEYIPMRHTNRRAYADETVPADVLDDLVAAAEAEATGLLVLGKERHRRLAAALSRRADEIENADADYRAELAFWTTDDPARRDGVQARSVPHVPDDRTASLDPLPVRAFDSRHNGWLPTSSESDSHQCLVLLTTERLDTLSWLKAGEALQRVWLEITRRGFWASPLTQAIEVRSTNAQLRAALGLTTHPTVLLRIGRAPAVPPTPRRRLDEMLLPGHAPLPATRAMTGHTG